MRTATQAFKEKVSISVTPTTSESFHPALKKKGLQIKISVHFTQEVMSFVDPSLKILENNSITVIHVPLVNDQQQLLISF